MSDVAPAPIKCQYIGCPDPATVCIPRANDTYLCDAHHRLSTIRFGCEFAFKRLGAPVPTTLGAPPIPTLKYIENTNGGATLADFVDDHAPIGPKLWEEVTSKGFAIEDSRGRVVLTASGIAALHG